MNDCTGITETECSPCGAGEFLDTWNRESRCHQHKYCDPSAWLLGKGHLGARLIVQLIPDRVAILVFL